MLLNTLQRTRSPHKKSYLAQNINRAMAEKPCILPELPHFSGSGDKAAEDPREPPAAEPQAEASLALERESQAGADTRGLPEECEIPGSPLQPHPTLISPALIPSGALGQLSPLGSAPSRCGALRGSRGRGEVLTTPMSATPEPTLMIVGMILNLPA